MRLTSGFCHNGSTKPVLLVFFAPNQLHDDDVFRVGERR